MQQNKAPKLFKLHTNVIQAVIQAFPKQLLKQKVKSSSRTTTAKSCQNPAELLKHTHTKPLMPHTYPVCMTRTQSLYQTVI